ncbi:hypothetical protein LTS18_014160, partial [Coniosporium uncinatum]
MGNKSRSGLSALQTHQDDDDDEEEANDRTPLISTSQRSRGSKPGTPRPTSQYGGFFGPANNSPKEGRGRKSSNASSKSRNRFNHSSRQHSQANLTEHDVNNPPSHPGSPHLGPSRHYDDNMITGGEMGRSRSSESAPYDRKNRDAIIDIEGNSSQNDRFGGSPDVSPGTDIGDMRRHTIANFAEEDVCFPQDAMSEEDYTPHNGEPGRPRRPKGRNWPDVSILEAWSTEEKESRAMEGVRARKIAEPVMVGGRLRPPRQAWHREVDDAPYRFTYFNE